MTKWTAPAWTLCISKPIPRSNRNAFTEIGVAWNTPNGGIKIATDVPLILTPELNLFLFPKEQNSPAGKKAEEFRNGDIDV